MEEDEQEEKDDVNEPEREQAPTEHKQHEHGHASYEERLNGVESAIAALSLGFSELEGRIAELSARINTKREREPDQDHFYFRQVGSGH